MQRQREPSEQVSGFQQRAQQGDCDPNKLAVGRQRLDVLPLGPEARERRKASDRANQNAETGKHDRVPPQAGPIGQALAAHNSRKPKQSRLCDEVIDEQSANHERHGRLRIDDVQKRGRHVEKAHLTDG